MAKKAKTNKPFNVLVIGQEGRLQYEAVLFAASLRHSDPGFKGRLFVAEPQPGPLWQSDPSIKQTEVLDLLYELGAEILPFENKYFGSSYPHGNKIEALAALPEGEPFVFFDTDTLITGPLSEVPFDYSKPTASLRCEGTWPEIELYGPSHGDIWGSLYDKFGLDIGPTIDPTQPEDFWKRYMYFNAGWFFYECPKKFGKTFMEYALAVRDDRPKELICQKIYPWLDQITLPLTVHALGGGRDSTAHEYLDGPVSCHYRLFPLMYAREADQAIEVLETVAAPNRIKKVLKAHEPIKKMVFQGKGQKVRDLFDQEHLPLREQMIRNRIKKENLWMR